MTGPVIFALVAWLAIGGCSIPLISCPLVADLDPPAHDCCPRNKPAAAMTDCPFFVAVKYVPLEGLQPIAASKPIFHDFEFVNRIAIRSETPDQHDLYLAIRVLRI